MIYGQQSFLKTSHSALLKQYKTGSFLDVKFLLLLKSSGKPKPKSYMYP